MNQPKAIWNDIRFQALALFVLFIAAYWVPLKTLVTIWLTNEDYSYGFLIPIASAYFLWEKRKELGNLEIKSSCVVLPLLLIFYLLSLYGTLGSSGNISMPAIPILIILFTAFCFGITLTKHLALPLGFLVFMVPVPSSVELSLGLFLKAVSSKLGGLIIRAADIPVHISGNVIDIGVTQLQVVDACSGMRYLFPLLALGVLYAYFFEKVTWKRIFCVLATIPISILTNALRIGATGILANHYGVGAAEGFFHGFSGWAIFMVAFAFLFLVGRILRLLPPRPNTSVETAIDQNRLKKESLPEDKGANGAFYTSIALLVVFGLLTLSTHALPPVKMQGGIASFPLKFSGWEGSAELVDPDIIIKSGAEESFSALYQNNRKDIVSLYIGYRSTAFLSNENFFHSPTVCLPASGWEEKETVTHLVKDVPLFGSITVTRMIVERMGTRQLVYFWFQTKDKTTHDKNINRFHLTLHALTRDNTYDLFIRPIMPINKGESVEDAEKRMNQFVREMMAAMLKFLKEKQIKEKV